MNKAPEGRHVKRERMMNIEQGMMNDEGKLRKSDMLIEIC